MARFRSHVLRLKLAATSLRRAHHTDTANGPRLRHITQAGTGTSPRQAPAHHPGTAQHPYTALKAHPIHSHSTSLLVSSQYCSASRRRSDPGGPIRNMSWAGTVGGSDGGHHGSATSGLDVGFSAFGDRDLAVPPLCPAQASAAGQTGRNTDSHTDSQPADNSPGRAGPSASSTAGAAASAGSRACPCTRAAPAPAVMARATTC